MGNSQEVQPQSPAIQEELPSLINQEIQQIPVISDQEIQHLKNEYEGLIIYQKINEFYDNLSKSIRRTKENVEELKNIKQNLEHKRDSLLAELQITCDKMTEKLHQLREDLSKKYNEEFNARINEIDDFIAHDQNVLQELNNFNSNIPSSSDREMKKQVFESHRYKSPYEIHECQVNELINTNMEAILEEMKKLPEVLVTLECENKYLEVNRSLDLHGSDYAVQNVGDENYFHMFNCRNNQYSKVEMKIQIPEASSMITYGSTIFGLGGLRGTGDNRNSLSDVFSINMKSKTEKLLPSLNIPRHGMSVQVHQGKLLAIGGGQIINGGQLVQKKAVEMLDLVEVGEWKQRSEMLVAVQEATAIVNQNYILVIGGAYRENQK